MLRIAVDVFMLPNWQRQSNNNHDIRSFYHIKAQSCNFNVENLTLGMFEH